MVLAPGAVYERQDVSEEVDDVQVDVEGSKDVLLGGDGVLVATSDHPLNVEHEVETEQQCSQAAVHNVNNLLHKTTVRGVTNRKETIIIENLSNYL